MQDLLTNLQQTLGPIWPVLAFLLILLVGYVIAKLVAAGVRTLFARTGIDQQIAKHVDQSPAKLDRIAGAVAFWTVMLLVLITALDYIDLGAISGPLGAFVNEVLGFIPNLIGAAVLAIVAYIVARVLQMITTKSLQAADIDARVAAAAGPDARPATTPGTTTDGSATAQAVATTAPAADPTAASREPKRSLAKTLGDAVFYLVLLLFLPAVLGELELGGILGPVQGLVNEILGFLPNLLLAGIILVVGAFVARILRRIVESLTAAAGADQLSERVGLSRATGGTSLSSLLGLVVYILVLVPVIVAALQALDVEAVTAPASAMLAEFMAAIPRIFMAAVILGIAFVVGRLVASLVSSLLTGVGFDRLFESLGFRAAGKPGAEGELDARTPSGLVGWVVLVAVMLFAATEAAAALGLGTLGTLIAGFTVLAGQVLLGLVIFAVGLYLSTLAYNAVRSSGTANAQMLAVAARVSILVLAGAMALRQMGLADSIINLAFGLLLGAIAVAAAIAFGIGGREVAKRKLEELVSKAESGELAAGGRQVIAPSQSAAAGTTAVPPSEA